MISEPEGNGEARDGSAPDRAVSVTSAATEHAYVREHYPTCTIAGKRLLFHDGRPLDVLTIAASDGTLRDLYFDISQFYGKGKQAGPPCPHCGKPLRTATAKQCRHCGRSWRDASLTVLRKRGAGGSAPP